MSVFAGRGDQAWAVAMLWRSPDAATGRTPPGPKPALSLEAIVAAAIAIADRDGLAGLAMRAVGKRLGRTAMALYTYVPGKEELLDLMIDGVHAELPGGYPPTAGWRAAVNGWCADLLAFYLRHPWILQVSHARPVLGPHEQRLLETVVRQLRATSLPAGQVRAAVSALFHLVRGTAQTIAEARRAASATGTPDEEWWAARTAPLREAVPDFAERFPDTAWLATDRPERAGDEPYLEAAAKQTFAGALAFLLDGVEAAAARRLS